MKSFDVEAAKAGEPVRTAAGQPVTILRFDRKHPKYPIVALVEGEEGIEYVQTYTSAGKITGMEVCGAGADLVMAPVKKTGWVNVYPRAHGRRKSGVDIYDTPEEARSGAFEETCIATTKIEWEE